jgi:uncharacterized membrane protein YfcA
LTDLWSILPLALLGAFLVGLAKGGLPVIGMLAVPLLALYIEPMIAAALLLPIYLISDAFGVWIYRREFSRRNLVILVPSGVAGVGAGYLAAPYLSVTMLNLMIGLIGIGFVVYGWILQPVQGQPRPARLLPGLFWGAMTGITSFVSHAGAPPFQVYALPQRLPKMVFAGTSTILFAAVNFAKLPPYLALGYFPRLDWGAMSLMAVAAICGVWVGKRLTHILPERVYYTTIRLALLVISLKLITDTFW